jgi:mycofactocin precursor
MDETTDADLTNGHDEAPGDGDVLLDELLVEEISIDGMCGVY